MTFQTLLAFGIPIMFGLSTLGGALGLGQAVAAALEATGRQPEASAKIQQTMLLGCAFIEALSLFSFVVMIILQGKLQ